MSRQVILRPEAQDDVAAARDWYEQQRAGLGEEFVEVVDDLLARLAATPEMHQIVLRDVRRAKLRRFPYVVYYRVLPDRVEVLAVLHGRRNPGVWQSRV
jgi:plasmid stabilization system protein ParE